MNGRRGAYLLLKSVVSLSIGLAFALPPPTAGTQSSLAFLVALHLPVWSAGLPWLVAAAAGVIGAYMRPPRGDGWAFAAIAAVFAAWAAIYLIGWIISITSGGTDGSQRGYFLAIPFAALAGATLLVSGMVGVDGLIRVAPPEDER